MSRTYGKNEWREDLKTLLRKTSTPDLMMVFLFIESQVEYAKYFKKKKKTSSDIFGFTNVYEQNSVDQRRRVSRRRQQYAELW